ncbi:hypothetical protein U1Q18_016135 [Sarracenia purpurea var. burkii]
MASSSSFNGPEEELKLMMDHRKRKRMISNRESARRSRLRKQKHLDDLTAQIAQLRQENHWIMTTMSVTTQQYLNVEAENSVLRAQMAELTQRLGSLSEILNCMNSIHDGVETDYQDLQTMITDSSITNSWSFMYLSEPIMASADEMFQC